MGMMKKNIWVFLLIIQLCVLGCDSSDSITLPVSAQTDANDNQEADVGSQEGPQAPVSNIANEQYRAHTFVTLGSASLGYRKWRNDDAPAVIVYLSGLQTHSQWFNDAGDTLSSNGYTVYALDRRGSGLSGGTRGDIFSGYTWITDLHQFINFVKNENPGIPIHLMANCFGTRISLGYSINYPGDIDSLILLTPGAFTKVDVSLEDKLLIAAQTKDKIPVPLTDDMYTSDPKLLDFIKDDALMLREVTARLYMQGEILNALVKILSPSIATPMLVLMSEEDEVIDTQSTMDDFYLPLTCQKQLVTYEGVKHFLLFESCNDAVLGEIMDWTALTH